MIELGLGRIKCLLRHTNFNFPAIHVAGTNGKGSVCAYASAMLHKANVRCGRFTSPHLIDRWDCITINEKTVNESVFRDVEASVEAWNKSRNVGASEFELLTATALQIFSQEHVDIGVIEAGMGGRLDATNILQNPLATVITKIGEDHQAFLGSSIPEIAYHKAGIMKRHVPCIVDGSNPLEAMEVLNASAVDVETGPVLRVPQDVGGADTQLWQILDRARFEEHQQVNISLALESVLQALKHLQRPLNIPRLAQAVKETQWQGRLQHLSIEPILGRPQNIFLDGAHNVQSAGVLASYVDRHLRMPVAPVTWIIAVSEGKNIRDLLSVLLRGGDNLVTVGFSGVEGMPWVKPTSSAVVASEAQKVVHLDHVEHYAGPVKNALQSAVEISKGGCVVVAGSLYLVSDVFRLLRNEIRGSAVE